jgi:hypothetical protein
MEALGSGLLRNQQRGRRRSGFGTPNADQSMLSWGRYAVMRLTPDRCCFGTPQRQPFYRQRRIDAFTWRPLSDATVLTRVICVNPAQKELGS